MEDICVRFFGCNMVILGHYYMQCSIIIDIFSNILKNIRQIIFYFSYLRGITMKKAVIVVFLFFTVYGQQIVQTFNAPTDGITGLAIHPSGQQNDELWAVSRSEETVYKINANTGEVAFSFPCVIDTNKLPTGLAYAGDIVYVAQWDGTIYGGWGYEYTTTGQYTGRTSLFC